MACTSNSLSILGMGRKRKTEACLGGPMLKKSNPRNTRFENPAADCASDSDSDYACEAPDSAKVHSNGCDKMEKPEPSSTSTGPSVKLKRSSGCLVEVGSLSSVNTDFGCRTLNNLSSATLATNCLPAPEVYENTPVRSGSTEACNALKWDDSDGEEAAEVEHTTVKRDMQPDSVWVLGHSFVQQAKQHLEFAREDGYPRGQEDGFHWLGIGGMRIGQLRAAVAAALKRGVPPPKIFVMHLGGNDLEELRRRALREAILLEMGWLRDTFPGIHVVWSNIIPRRNWRSERPARVMNTSVRKLNAELQKLLGGTAWTTPLRHGLLVSTDLFDTDGVHLSAEGLDIFIDTIRGCVQSVALVVEGGGVPVDPRALLRCLSWKGGEKK